MCLNGCTEFSTKGAQRVSGTMVERISHVRAGLLRHAYHQHMTPELQRALKRHTQWFGSYKVSGELTKVQVWRVLNSGQIECLTLGSSYKVRRVRRNPRVICYVGSKDGPAISGTAQIITDRSEVARVYRCYWKVHPVRMAIVIGLRVWIEMLFNKRVVVRVQPDDPNPVAGLTDLA